MKRISILLSGKVQGVYFRASTEKIATRIGVCGFVKNLPNGKVFIEAQGTEEQLQELINWCRLGPERARVDELSTAEIPLQEDSGFHISR